LHPVGADAQGNGAREAKIAITLRPEGFQETRSTNASLRRGVVPDFFTESE